MTKKKGYLLEQVANIENLRLAVKNSQRGGKAKRSWQIKEFNEHRDTNLLQMQNMILRLSFPEHHSRKLQRKADKNKIRDLDDEDYKPWKVMSHAIMQVIEPIVIKMLIADTSCCVPGRGCLYGVKRMKKLLRRNPEYTWAAQSDCKKYYQSISSEYMERVLRHKFKDKKFVKLVLICVFDYYCGEAIEKSLSDEQAQKERSANYISALIGNLNHNEIDHILTEQYGAKLHRNCDDMVMLGRSKAEVRFLLNAYDRLAAERGMVVKANSYYAPIRHHERKKKGRWRRRGPKH